MIRVPLWKWSLGTFLILSIWVFTAPFFGVFADVFIGREGAWRSLASELLPFIPLFLATPIVWSRVIRRPVRELINISGALSRRQLIVGFIGWLILASIGTGVDALLHPSDYRFTFEASTFIPFLLVAMVLLPVQTSAEEFFFRGWILRWAQHLSAPVAAVISGVVFALPHMGNPEAVGQTAIALSAWFLLGATWAYVSARDGGIELALGAHLANNAFSLLLVGYDDAALPTAAIWTTSSLNMMATLISLLLMAPIFIRLSKQSR